VKDDDLYFKGSQRYIGKKLKQYLCIDKNKKDVNFIKEFEWSYNVGLCWLWWWVSFRKLLQIDGAKTAKDDESEINYDWFYRVENSISDWDGESKLDDKSSQDISKFFSLIKYFSSIDQNTPWYMGVLDGSISEICRHDLLEFSFGGYNNGFKWNQNTLKQSLEAAKDKKIIKEYSLGSLFSVKQVKELLQTENFVQDGRLILFELFETGRCSALLKLYGEYFYFNPQSFEKNTEFVSSSIDEIAELICKNHFYYYFYIKEAEYAADKEEAKEFFRNHIGSFPLGIKIFAFDDGKVANYPSQETVLRNIGVDIQRKQYCSLNMAVRVGDLNSTKYFLENGADSNFRGYEVGDTPIISAAFYGDIELFETLLARGADINVQEHRYGYTPLMFAAANGHYEIVKKLLARGADYNIHGKEGESVLLRAAESACAEITKELLKLKIDPNIKTNNNTTPLMLAAEFGHVAVMKELIKNGADLNLKSKRGVSALMPATRYGYSEAVQILIEKGADLNIRSMFGIRTALMLAIDYNHLEIAKKLINARAEINIRDPLLGKCAIMLAIERGHIEIVKELIKAGANVNIDVDLYGHLGTLLMLAIKKEQPEIASELIKAGVDLNVKTGIDGETALIMAIEKGYGALAKELIKAGANVNIDVDLYGHSGTLLMLAIKRRQPKIASELIKAGVNLNVKTGLARETALLMAVGKGYGDLVKELIAAGADVNSKNKYEDTPLSVAKGLKNGNAIINELIKAGAKDRINIAAPVYGKNKFETEKVVATSSDSMHKEHIETCDDNRIAVVKTLEKLADTNDPLPTPKEINAFVNEYVIGQDNAKKVLSVAIYNHYKRLRYQNNKKNNIELNKSNILLIGPTGSGKTLLAETLARTLNVPFAIADATTLTETGYVGDDVETVIQKLLQSCDFDVQKAENGIIYIDEIDKISGKGDETSVRNSFDEGVQQDLLKLIEGTIANVPLRGRHKTDKGESVHVNTKNILFICGGAFPGLDKIIKARTEKQRIGFSAEIYGEKDKKAINELLSKVKPEDLMQYGLISEFIGRLPVIAVLNEIDEAEMVRILREPKNALIEQYKELFSMDNIEIEFQDEVLKTIAQKALLEKTGARGLRTILENLLLDIMYDLPTQKKQGKIMIDQKFINTD